MKILNEGLVESIGVDDLLNAFILKRAEILQDQTRNAGDGEEDVEKVGRH